MGQRPVLQVSPACSTWHSTPVPPPNHPAAAAAAAPPPSAEPPSVEEELQLLKYYGSKLQHVCRELRLPRRVLGTALTYLKVGV